MKRSTVTALALLILTGGFLIAQEQPRDPYARFFTLRGITFSKEQQTKVDALRKELSPKLAENQRKWNGVLTREQQRARREALQKARDAGKRGQELRDSVNASIKLTDEQKKQQADLLEERNRLQTEIRTMLTALLTEEQRTKLRGRQPARAQVPPTHADVKYGPHRRNVMDVWLAKSDKPTPVLISIHGGGFRGGNKSVSAGLLRQCLSEGISVVAITYRLSSDAIAPASFHDSARAVQYVRHKAKEWNLDRKRIAAAGGSAGAGISLWLGFHDDLADPDNKDPILRESTRLTCMAVTAGQTSYDPRFIRKLFPGTDTYQHSALAQLYDVDLSKLDDLPEEKYRLFEECSPLHHLTKDDAPALLNYGGTFDQKITNVGIGIHHAKFGKVLKEKMDALKIRCIVNARGEVLGDRVSVIEFLKQEFGIAK